MTIAPPRPPRSRRQIATPSVLTGEELYAQGDIGRAELIKGEITPMSPTGYMHGFIEGNFYAAIREVVLSKQLGQTLVGEVGIYTHRNPDTVRAADVTFISTGRMAQVKSRSYLDVAPELVVEVMSPDDRWSGVMEKLAEYFQAGVLAVWVADPASEQVFIYRSLTDVEQLSPEDTLTGGEILPGFAVKVSDFF